MNNINNTNYIQKDINNLFLVIKLFVSYGHKPTYQK